MSLKRISPWQETFADAGDDDMGGGPFGTMLGPFQNNFRIPYAKNKGEGVFQLKIDFLEMAHTNLFSSIRKAAYQPLIELKLAEKCSKETLLLSFFVFQIITNIYFNKITQILIQTFEITTCNTKHTQNTPIHFQQSFIVVSKNT